MQTISSIRGIFLAMALYPAVFKKAREEIDAVVGTQRLPSIADKAHLPYMTALVYELLRWTVALPNGQYQPLFAFKVVSDIHTA